MILFVFFSLCSSFESNFTYMDVTVKYGIERVEYAYFGSSIKPGPAINLTYNGHVELPEAVKIGNRTYLFMMLCDYSFANTQISSITLPSPLRWIGKSVFENCTNLMSINAKEVNLSALGERCFYGCANLTEFIFPDSLVYIGASCFEGIQIPYVPVFPFEDLGSKAFANNQQLTEVDLSLCKFRTIAESLFDNCTNLEKITLPPNLFWIRTRAFANTSLTFLKLPRTTKLVHKYVYSDCLNIVNADFSDYPLKCISDGMFFNCVNLKTVTLPKVCYWIGSYAFYNTSIESLVLPSMMHTCGEYAFANCLKLTKFDMSHSVVDSISNGLLYNCSNLEEFSISSIILSIGNFSFAKTSLPSIGDSFPLLESLNSSSFTDSSLESIDLSSCTKLIELPSHLFDGVKSLTSIILPPTLQTISEYCFCNSLLTKIVLPPSVIYIHEYAFKKCKQITKIDLSHLHITNISKGCFKHCNRLAVIKLPENVVEYIDDMAFYGCQGLISFSFPNCLKYIGSYSFYACQSLTECILNETNVELIMNSCFQNCKKLKVVEFPTTLLGTGTKAFAYTAIEQVTIYHSIGTDCFLGCEYLISVDMSKSTLNTLVSSLFGECSRLSVVKLPHYIKRISPLVFSGCTKLKTVEYYPPKPIFEENVFPQNVNFVPYVE